jgi:ABC-2 type transport system ATP-binding protein
MMEVTDLGRRYGALVALDSVSFAVRPGEIAGLLGANGAGKSTLIRTAAGLQAPDTGTVRIAGVDLWSDPVPAKQRLGYASEEPVFYEELSADEYLSFVATLRHLDPPAARERAHDLATRLGLGARLDEPVRQFSHGMRKKLSFLAAILHRPAVLLCDEALEGFDAEAALAAKDELRSLAKSGCAVLFSSHVTETIERLCDRVVLLHHGRVARTLERAEWGSTSTDLSPLERAFLEVVRARDDSGSR